MAYDQRSRHEAQSFHDQRNAEYTVSLSHSQGQRHSDPSRGSFDRKHYGQLESRNHIASQYGGQHGSAHGHAWRDTLQRMDYAQPSGPYPVEGETQGRVQKGQPPTHGPYDRRTRGYGEGNGHGLEGQLMRPGWNERTINQPHLPKPIKESIIPKPTSPVTAGWDNPFPTFPSSRPKPRQTEDRTLSNSVAEKNIHEVVRESESPRGSQNRGSNNKGSQSSSRGQESRNNRVGLGPRNRQRRDPRSNGNHPEIPQHGKAETQRTVRRVAQPSVNLLRTGLAYDDRSVAQVHDNGRRQHQDSHFDPAYIAPPLPSNTAVDMGSQRSMTMPNEFTEVKLEPKPHQRYPDPLEWQEPGPTGGYYGPESQIIIPQRPATSSGSRPTVSAHPWPDEATRSYGNGAESAAIHDDMKIHVKQESLSDFFDSYYDVTPGGSSARANGFEHRPSLEEEMPNFDAVPVTRPAHSRDMTIEQHLQPRESVPNVPSMPAYALDSPEWHHNSSFAGQAAWSKSQPDYGGRSQPQSGNDAGFVFELAGDVPAAPQIPSHFDSWAQHNHDRNGDVKSKGQYNDQSAQRSEGGAWSAIQAYKGVGEDNDRTQSGRQRQVQHHSLSPYNPQLELPVPRANFEQRTGGSEISLSPINQSVSTHQPMVRPGNPDALPEHPTPVRLGLMPGSMANQAPKPPPIRQYNSSASPIQQSGPTSQPVASRPSQEKRVFAPVTLDELERLKRIIKTNPTDQKTQLILAKKWVEAASVLADEGGRADPKTRNKNRERYILDAHKIIKKLVSSGNPDAMFYLADCHGRGLLGLETDNKEAFTLYQSAAKVGHAQSAYRVAVCCEMGHEQGGGTRRDPLKAMQWYKRAAMLGDTPAMYKMGMILLKGLLGQPKHPREAIVWLKRAADLADEENPHALHELGLLYENASGNDHIIRDEQYSKQLFTQAAELGYKFSQFRLGCAYEYGLMGCAIDPRQSIAWYSRAAVREEHQSELALSGWYLTGSEGVLQQSDTEAYLWARKAAHAGLAKAEYAMGYFTEVGIGAPANIEDAKRWYWRAASQNFPKARERLEDLRKGGAKMQKSRVSRSAVNKQSEGDCVVM